MDTYIADVERLGDRGVPVMFITTPMVMVSHVTGLQRFLEWSVAEETLVVRMVAAAAHRLTERLRYVLDRGAGPSFHFGGSEQATPPFMSKRGFDRYILRYHYHGKIDTVLDEFVAGGVQLTDPVEPPPQGDIDIVEAKRRAAAGPMTLIGNLEQSDIRTLNSDQVEKLVHHAVCDGGRKHFILGVSDVVISEVDDRTSENLIRFIEAGIKHGTGRC